MGAAGNFMKSSGGFQRQRGAAVEHTAPEGQEQGHGDEDGADPRGCGKTHRRFHHQTAKPCANGDAEVEGGDVERRGDIDSAGAMFLGKLHHIKLQAGNIGEGQEAERGKRDERQHRREGGEGKDEQHDGLRQEEADQRPGRVMVGDPAAADIAGRNGDAIEHEDQADALFGKAGDILQDRRKEGEGDEGAAVTKRGHGENDEQATGAENTDLIDEARRRRLLERVRQKRGNAEEGDDAKGGNDPEGRTPAEDLPDIGAERNAGDDGDRQPHEHHGNGRSATIFRHEIRGDGGADREEDTMGEGGDDAGDKQHLIAGRQGRSAVADDEQGHQAEQQRLSFDPAGQRRQDRRTKGDAQRINADDETGKRQGDVKIGRDRRQKTDNHELRGADRIGRDRQGKYGQWHDKYLFARSGIAGVLDSNAVRLDHLDSDAIRLDQIHGRNMGEGDLHDNRQGWINTFELISQVVRRWTIGPEKWKSSWRRRNLAAFPPPGAG
ncbi:hypothetical protein AGR7B_Cc250061 [Agrobacterium deltaense RV3]|nr:hypothetical protein AGR7B_Cc250061 [Agrobacterium deltaense RV3]